MLVISVLFEGLIFYLTTSEKFIGEIGSRGNWAFGFAHFPGAIICLALGIDTSVASSDKIFLFFALTNIFLFSILITFISIIFSGDKSK